MMKYLCLILMASLMFFGTAFASVYPRTDVVVEGKFVMLGDIFEGLSSKAEEIVCAAPRVGKHLSITADQLRFLSLHHGLKWQPTTDNFIVTVERASRTYSDEELLAIVEAKIFPTLSTEYNHLLSLDRKHPEIIVPLEEEDSLVCSDVKVKGTRFQARFEMEDGAAVLISGRIQSLIEVPTLVRTITPGEIIMEEDIKMAEASQSQVRGAVVRKMEDIIGTTPRLRPLSSGTVIKLSEVQKPILIERGKLVSMIFKSHKLLIAGAGKALQNGSEGDMIRIMNTDSRKVIQGLVTGPGQVEVGLHAS